MYSSPHRLRYITEINIITTITSTTTSTITTVLRVYCIHSHIITSNTLIYIYNIQELFLFSFLLEFHNSRYMYILSSPCLAVYTVHHLSSLFLFNPPSLSFILFRSLTLSLSLESTI